MTMEMWSFGFTMDRLRLLLFLLASIPLLARLSYHVGFEETFSWKDDLLDAFVAYAVACVIAALILWLTGVIEPGMSIDAVVGIVTLQAFPGSLGALLAQTQLGGHKPQDRDRHPITRYFGELFLMLIGALFLALNLAPTEEVILIAYKQRPWHAVVMVLISLGIMHTFVYLVEFRGQHEQPQGVSMMSVFIRFSVVGYALALLASAFMLWIFGRTDGQAFEQVLRSAVVLAFPFRPQLAQQPG